MWQWLRLSESDLRGKRVMARGTVHSITKLIDAIPSFSPFDKGGWGDFKIDFLES
jgi:hypothetical protein